MLRRSINVLLLFGAPSRLPFPPRRPLHLAAFMEGVWLLKEVTLFCFWFLYPHRSCLSVCSDLSLGCLAQSPTYSPPPRTPVPVA